jgi:hypothetical protein
MKNIFKKSTKAKKPIKKPTKSPKLPSVWALTKKTWFEVSTFWRPLLGVTIIFAVLYFALVLGLNLSSSWQDELVLSGNGAFSLVFGALYSSGLGSSVSSDSTTLVQILLIVLASMAFVWTLRKLQGLKQIKWRDAYYQGTAAFIPTILVCVVLVLSLIPAIISSSLLATALQFSPPVAEIIIIGAVTALLLFLSVMLFTMWWPAFYIVSLPQTRPFQALKSAKKVTKRRRLAIFRKSIAWLIICLVVAFILLLPVAIVIPAVVGYCAFALLFVLFGFSHVYLYNLYRSLL